MKKKDSIEEVVIETLGEDALPLLHAMKNKVNVSEFKLADKINKEVNSTRNLLYKLHNLNVASFIRRKDKKKGWYIYYWTLNKKGAEHSLKKQKVAKKEILLERLKREKSGNFFICPENCIRLDFDKAFEFEFKCPECGETIHPEDNRNKIKKLEENLKKLE